MKVADQNRGLDAFITLARGATSASFERLSMARARAHFTCSLSLAVLAFGILVRFLYLDADPNYSEWLGFITDEGRWVHHGRSLALHGSVTDGRSLHLFLAPLFQLSNFLVFELAGVTMLTARMLTAFCGSAILVLVWVYLRPVISPQALLLAVTLLAFQADLVVFSRLAVPEMALMFFQLVIYLMIVSSEKSLWWIVAAGVLMASVLAVKLTILLVVPIFVVMVFVMPRSTAMKERRWRDLGLFAAGLMVPLVVVGLGSFVYLGSVPAFRNMTQYLSTAAAFLALASPYSMISFPFDHTLSSTFNLWALGFWLSALGWLAGYRTLDSLSHRYLVTSATWFVLYLLLMLTLEYFPSRYKIHILLPMALFISVGISLLQRLGIERIMESIAGAKGFWSAVWIGAVSAPSAGLLSRLLVPVATIAGVDALRLSGKLTILLVALISGICILYRFKYNERVVRFFLVFPLIGGMGWGLFSTISSYSFWPAPGSDHLGVVLLLAVLLVLTACFVLRSTTLWWKSRSTACLVSACAVFYLTISMIRIVPGYLDPHYSMRATSRDLGTLLSGYGRIGSIGADGLFNENNLVYESLTAPEFNLLVEKPQVVVVAFNHKWIRNTLDREYGLMKTYDVYEFPGYDRNRRVGGSPSSKGVLVTVYKRNDAGK